MMYSCVAGFNEITYAIRESSFQIARVWGSDEAVAKALSHFLELGMRSTSPLLGLDFKDLVSLLETGYTMAPFSCWLDTASFVMTVYGGQTTHYEELKNLLFALTNKTMAFIHGAEGKYNAHMTHIARTNYSKKPWSNIQMSSIVILVCCQE